MAFPADPLPIRQEMQIGGTWVDVTDRTRNNGDVVITRGYSGEQASLSASSAVFALNSRDGRFSNRNPRSPYYRQIGRNTPYRVSVEETTKFMWLADYSTNTGGYDAARAWTADKAVLDIVGDIDLRWDVQPDNWRGGEGIMLGGKYTTTSDERSWAVFITPEGYARIIWSTDGTVANRVIVTSTAKLPTAGRAAIRVTLDVDNGAAGNTVTFYTSDTIGGSWTILGAAVVTAGVTSIYAGTSQLDVGTANAGSGRGSLFVNPSVDPFVGRVYGFEMYSGIGGTLVADFDPTGRAVGDTTWSDGLGTPNTWTLDTSASISDADYRFRGEMSKMPQRWDSTGTDVYVPASAADIIQRLGQGRKALRSPVYRNLIQSTMSGYWPMEDGFEATQATAYVGSAGRIFDSRFGSTTGFGGTAGSLSFNSDASFASGVAVGGLSNTGTAYILFSFKLPAVPAAARSIMNFRFEGSTVVNVNITVDVATYTLTFTDSVPTTLDTSNTLFGTGGEPDQWVTMRLRMVQDGANIDWDWGWYPNGSPVFFGVSGTFAGTVGRPVSWSSPAWTGKADAELAHVALAREDIGFTDFDFYGSANGYIDELVSARFARLCREEGIPYWVVGRRLNNAGESLQEAMGPQTASKFLDLLVECADVGGGLLYGPRDKFGIGLRLRTSLLNREPVDLDYSANVLSGELQPEEDDSLIRNDVTVERPQGGTGRSVQESGPLNVNDPEDDPDGVGTYDTKLIRNVSSEERLPALAQLERFYGTWDELRYARVEVNLSRAPFLASPSLAASVRAVNLGDVLGITNLPDWLPPDDVELLVRGYVETLQNRGHVFRWNTSPYGPYRSAELGGTGDATVRVDATNSALAGDITDTATALVVKTPTGARWRRSAGAVAGTYPLTALVGGETMTVSDVADVTLSYVAAGAVSHGNNADVTPGLPAGLATGDVMVMLAAIRTTAGSVTTPTGWTVIASMANVALFGRLAQASGNAPTVAFTGGSAGDDTSAQIAAFRPSSGLSTTSLPSEWLSQAQWTVNASAQDITYTGEPLQDRTWDNAVVLYLGWKQDDWTSVASPGTEIGEPDTTTGNDQGIVWAYTIQTTRTAVAGGSFVVTGGASAVSQAAVVFLHPRHQAFTVSARAVNGMDLTHDQDDPISLAVPARLGL